jgi:Sugar-specific transcriptional regulator TrmB
VTDTAILNAIADCFDAASTKLREHIALLTAVEPATEAEPTTKNVAARARAIHPQIGPRQIEVLEVLEGAGTKGTRTGHISSVIGYDQPNVYLTLQSLMALGFVAKDETRRPHIYRLAGRLTG